jgi:protocatechuate 3,4-dioxygenase beta subunit
MSSSSFDTVQGRRQRRRGKLLVSNGNNHAMIGKEEEEGSKILMTGTITSENRKPLRDVIAFYCELWGCNTITGDDDW